MDYICCRVDTAGNHESNCPLYKEKVYGELVPAGNLQGWECPRCRTINGPFIQQCDCKSHKNECVEGVR